MSRKKILIGISVLCALLVCFVMGRSLFPDEYKVKEDEIALRIRLDVKEDIGLVVYDYTVDGHECSGGVSNADRSMIRHDEELIETWSKEELKRILGREPASGNYPFEMKLRIITEYFDPNYENIYPEDSTRYLEPVSWTASFGEEYIIRITGSKARGYTLSLE